MAQPTCCYLYPSEYHPSGDPEQPCTARIEYGIWEQRGDPYDSLYACSAHLGALAETFVDPVVYRTDDGGTVLDWSRVTNVVAVRRD